MINEVRNIILTNWFTTILQERFQACGGVVLLVPPPRVSFALNMRISFFDLQKIKILEKKAVCKRNVN